MAFFQAFDCVQMKTQKYNRWRYNPDPESCKQEDDVGQIVLYTSACEDVFFFLLFFFLRNEGGKNPIFKNNHVCMSVWTMSVSFRLEELLGVMDVFFLTIL